MINTNNEGVVLSNSERQVKVDYELLNTELITSAKHWFNEWLVQVRDWDIPEEWNDMTDKAIQRKVVEEFNRYFMPFEDKAHQLGLGDMLYVDE